MLKKYYSFLLTIISGILLSTSICISSLSLLQFIAFIPFLFAIHQKNLKETALYSFITGYISLSAILFSIAAFNFAIYILFTLLLSLTVIYIGTLYRYLNIKFTNWFIIYTLPIFWVILEIFATEGFLSLPLNLGLGQYRNIILIQIADIFGIYGISFLVMLINISLFYLLIQIKENKQKINWLPLLPPLIIISCTFIYGGMELNQAEKKDNIKSFALIQGNLNFEELVLRYKSRKFHKISEDRYFRMIQEAAKQNPDYIIVPESGLMGYFLNIPNLNRKYKQLAIDVGTNLIFQGKEKSEGKLYSTMFMVSNNGSVIGISRKYKPIHLAEIDFSHNKSFAPIKTNNIYIGVQICFDICFPSISRKLVQNKATVLVVSSNDGRFGYSPFSILHHSFLAFRAIENRRSILSANNSGISSSINSKGEIKQESQINTETILYAKVSTQSGQTLFNKSGFINIFIFLGTYLLIGIIGVLGDKQIS